MSHTAGYPAWQPYWDRMRNSLSSETLFEIPISERQREMKKMIMSETLEVQPGKRALYSDISFLLLGFILEEVMKLPLDIAVKRTLWGPMGLINSSYARTSHSAGDAAGFKMNQNVAPTEDCSWRKSVTKGQVHDDNCWAMGGYGGHAGAFGNLRDLLWFARELMGGFLSHEILKKMWTPVSQPPNCERTLGWDTPSQNSMTGKYFSPWSVGHWGFTGTSLWVDLEKQTAVVLLTNRVHPNRENIKIRKFRPMFHDTLLEQA